MTRKEARERVCIAIASQLDDVDATSLISDRNKDKAIDYEVDLGIDEEGRTVFVRPLNVVFKAHNIRWGVAEVRSLSSVKATEDRAVEKSKEQ